jgi:hypothetical protein
MPLQEKHLLELIKKEQLKIYISVSIMIKNDMKIPMKIEMKKSLTQEEWLYRKSLFALIRSYDDIFNTEKTTVLIRGLERSIPGIREGEKSLICYELEKFILNRHYATQVISETNISPDKFNTPESKKSIEQVMFRLTLQECLSFEERKHDILAIIQHWVVHYIEKQPVVSDLNNIEKSVNNYIDENRAFQKELACLGAGDLKLLKSYMKNQAARLCLTEILLAKADEKFVMSPKEQELKAFFSATPELNFFDQKIRNEVISTAIHRFYEIRMAREQVIDEPNEAYLKRSRNKMGKRCSIL